MDDPRTILVEDVFWGGVPAGVLAGLVTQVVLSLAGIGVGTAEPTVTAQFVRNVCLSDGGIA